MKVLEPTVGPILGATTGESARIFLRGDYEDTKGRPRRCHAVVRPRRKGAGPWTTRYVELDPNFAPDKQIDEVNAPRVILPGALRRTMARVPTYMTLDDHEIEDNWPAKVDERDLVREFPAAMHAYLTYQLSHSPLLDVRGGALSGTPHKLCRVTTPRAAV